MTSPAIERVTKSTGFGRAKLEASIRLAAEPNSIRIAWCSDRLGEDAGSACFASLSGRRRIRSNGSALLIGCSKASA